MTNDELIRSRLERMLRDHLESPAVRVLELEIAKARLARGESVRSVVGGVPAVVTPRGDGSVGVEVDLEALGEILLCEGCGFRLTNKGETCECGSSETVDFLGTFDRVTTDRAWRRSVREDLRPLLETALLDIDNQLGLVVSPARCHCSADCGCRRLAVTADDERFTCASCARWEGCDACNRVHCPSDPCPLGLA